MKTREFIKELKKHQKMSKGQKSIVSLNNNILITRIGLQSCELRSTNLLTSLNTECNNIDRIFFEDSFDSVLINPDLLIKYLSSAKDDIWFSIENDKVVINDSVKMVYVEPNMYPDIVPFKNTEICVHVELSMLKRFVKYTGSDCINRMYSGFNFQYDKETGDAVLAVTDLKIIASYNNLDYHIEKDMNDEINFNATFDSNVIKFLDNENLVISFDKTFAYIEDGNTELITTLFEGKYPVYQVVYRKQHKNSYYINKDELSAFLSLVGKDETCIEMDFSEDGFVACKTISSDDFSTALQKIACKKVKNDEYVGLVQKIGLNPQYLKKIIKYSIPESWTVVEIRIGYCTEPVLFFHDNLVLMPMRVE
jgi:DNA polymerase III sliding clamp (beta) subunit (PCNA family)